MNLHPGFSSALDTAQDVNRYIDRNIKNYSVCCWALEVKPQAKTCWDDCPFEDCIKAEVHPAHQYARPKCLDEFIKSQTLLNQCDIVSSH